MRGIFIFSNAFMKMVETSFLKVSSALLMLLLTFLLAKSLTIDDAGHVMYFISLILFGGVVGTFGLAPEVTRISALLGKNITDNSHAVLLVKIYILPFILYVTLLIVLMLLKAYIPISLQAVPLELALFGGFLVAFNKLFCATLQGLGSFKKSIIFDQILWAIIAIVMIGFLYIAPY